MATYKIIFTGTVGSEKTTAVTSLSDIAPVNTLGFSWPSADRNRP
jgi:signal recognition particle receptor subunit beta